MGPSVRKVLADSHVTAIAIALLLLISFANACRAVWIPLAWALGFVFNAVAIVGVPYYSTSLTIADRVSLDKRIPDLFTAVLGFAAACLLSAWVYGAGPVPSLRRYHALLRRWAHV